MHEEVVGMGMVDKPFESGRIVGREGIAAATSGPIRPLLMQFDDLHAIAAVFLEAGEIRFINRTMGQRGILVMVIPHLPRLVVQQQFLPQTTHEMLTNPAQILQSSIIHKRPAPRTSASS